MDEKIIPVILRSVKFNDDDGNDKKGVIFIDNSGAVINKDNQQ